ncbi:AraC family transcriptional regulator [Microlunatus speluncae]|uniref:AraC family transcriptional regulator n=1 Tax=Microlunatus speluncae TaxID=2594267 RepID=UPI00126638E8|nr:AraC family transcriptional regulator [Microlunatus speluncae]
MSDLPSPALMSLVPTAGDRSRGFPFVVQAGHTQFQPGHRLSYGSVQSIAVVGCHSGRGVVELNGVDHPLRPGLLYLMPWNHSIDYRSDPRDPFFVFGVHVIPWQRATEALAYEAPHEADEPLYDVEWRRARAPGQPPPVREVTATTEADRPALAALARFIIERFRRGHPTTAESRSLGLLMMVELTTDSPPRPEEDPALPVHLRGLLVWIIRDLSRPMSLADLAGVLECSPSTVTRLFRRHLGCPPLEWVTRQRLRHAQRLLAENHETIAIVARNCGFDDPWYFTRVFKARVGVTPKEWRLHRTI